jgi:hypothetical protein
MQHQPQGPRGPLLCSPAFHLRPRHCRCELGKTSKPGGPICSDRTRSALAFRVDLLPIRMLRRSLQPCISSASRKPAMCLRIRGHLAAPTAGPRCVCVDRRPVLAPQTATQLRPRATLEFPCGPRRRGVGGCEEGQPFSAAPLCPRRVDRCASYSFISMFLWRACLACWLQGHLAQRAPISYFSPIEFSAGRLGLAATSAPD